MTSPDHGVIALDVTSPDLDLSALLRGTASRFNPHITLMPRFPIRNLKTVVADWTPIVSSLNLPSHHLYRLSGPKWPERDLCWYEFGDDIDGRNLLQQAHEAALSQALHAGLIEKPPHFSGKSFHPHMTIAWRAEPQGNLPGSLTLLGKAITLYTYRGDPHESDVTRIELCALSVAPGLST